MKKVMIMILACFIILTFTGCFKAISLNDRVIVQAIGIDKDGDDIKITLQIFSPTAKGNETIDVKANNANLITVTGKNISEAFSNATLKQGKKIFIGHNQLIIFGSEIAKEGISDALAYFTSNPFAREDAHLLVAEKTANEVLSTNINQGILPADAIKEMILNYTVNGFTTAVTFFEFMSSFSNHNKSAFIPVIKVSNEQDEKKSEKEDEKEIQKLDGVYLDGTAIFKEKKMSALIDKADTRGLLFLREKIKKTMYFAKAGKFEMANIEIYKSKSKIIPNISEGKISFKVMIDCQATLENFTLSEPATYADFPNIENVVEEKIKNECLSVFNKTIIEEKADVLLLGDEIWREDKKFWQTIQDDWQENCDKITITIVPTVKINRIGLKDLE